ncbi:MAG: CAP domain-containing protein [Clostridiales bacterium]|nr:CAP domain-containing protein [Clostridiales bacterium]
MKKKAMILIATSILTLNSFSVFAAEKTNCNSYKSINVLSTSQFKDLCNKYLTNNSYDFSDIVLHDRKNDCNNNINGNTGNENNGNANNNTCNENSGNNNTSKPDNSVSSESRYISEVVRLVNAERAKEGLAALQMDSSLNSAAQVRAKEIVTSFSHTRPNGSNCFTALSEAGIKYNGSGENIAYGQKTPAEVVNAWMNSAGHRANIMSSKFTKIGVGCHNSNGTYYWSQFFTY